jgi:hypothetical protein
MKEQTISFGHHGFDPQNAHPFTPLPGPPSWGREAAFLELWASIATSQHFWI